VLLPENVGCQTEDLTTDPAMEHQLLPHIYFADMICLGQLVLTYHIPHLA
jgi:hypothetical protein